MRAGWGHRCCPLFFPAATGAQTDVCVHVCWVGFGSRPKSVCPGAWHPAEHPEDGRQGCGQRLPPSWLSQDRPGACLPPTPFPSPQSVWPAGNLEVTEPGMNEVLSTQRSFSGWEATCLLWSGWAPFCVLAQRSGRAVPEDQGGDVGFVWYCRAGGRGVCVEEVGGPGACTEMTGTAL